MILKLIYYSTNYSFNIMKTLFISEQQTVVLNTKYKAYFEIKINFLYTIIQLNSLRILFY